MEEHRIIERVLGALELATRRLETDHLVGAAFFVATADFIKGFADGCHHKKEEDVLFPAMVSAGVPSGGGSIGVMLAEHEEGRRLTRAMRGAAEKLAAGQVEARGAVIENASAYIILLRQHIAKEDGVLFPIAERVIPPAEQAELAAAFDRVELEETGEGVHEKYLGMADQLEQEARG